MMPGLQLVYFRFLASALTRTEWEMSISMELSSELAAELLTKKNNDEPIDMKQRVAIAAQVHTTLRKLAAKEREERRRLKPALKPTNLSSSELSSPKYRP